MVKDFNKKSPPQMFDRDLNTPLVHYNRLKINIEHGWKDQVGKFLLKVKNITRSCSSVFIVVFE